MSFASVVALLRQHGAVALGGSFGRGEQPRDYQVLLAADGNLIGFRSRNLIRKVPQLGAEVFDDPRFREVRCAQILQERTVVLKLR